MKEENEFWDEKTIKYCDKKLKKLDDMVLSCLGKYNIFAVSQERFSPVKEPNKNHDYILKVTPKEDITFLDIESFNKLSQQFCSALKNFNYLNDFPEIDKKVLETSSFVYPFKITFENGRSIAKCPYLDTFLDIDYPKDYVYVEVNYKVILYPSSQYLQKSLNKINHNIIGFIDLKHIDIEKYNRMFKED